MSKATFLINRYSLFFLTISLIFINSFSLLGQASDCASANWVGTWATAPQLVEPHNMPPKPGLTNNSLRQIVRVSIGGEKLRLKLSNEFSKDPITIKSVQIAVSTGASAIDVSSNKELKFKGSAEVIIKEGEAVLSDPIDFHLDARMDLAITTYYGETSLTVSGHPGSRTTSYLIEGNSPSVTDFSESVETDHWYNINRIDVMASEDASAIAILGNSITDGRGSITNKQNRWPDILSEELLKDPKSNNIGVLNLGIGGNAILVGGLGPTGLKRFERDIIEQPGVKWMIIYHGVNDIGGVRSAEMAEKRAQDLITAYKLMANTAKENNIVVFGATILPFKGNGYYNEHSEHCRNLVNNWILNNDLFEAVIDFATVLQHPDDPLRIISSFQNDGLHPDAEGYQKMGKAAAEVFLLNL